MIEDCSYKDESTKKSELRYIGKGIASVAVCGLGAFSMYITAGNITPTGVGWAILGLLIIWG